MLPREFPGGRLRRLRPADLSAFQAYRSIPEVGRYQGWSPMAEDEALAFLTEMHDAPLFTPGHWVQLGIADGDSDRLIGDIGLHLSADGRIGEVGFTLEPAAQGRGLATAAVAQALHVFFASTDVREVLGVTDARNVASVRLLLRLGFRHRETRSVIFRGEQCDEETYSIERST